MRNRSFIPIYSVLAVCLALALFSSNGMGSRFAENPHFDPPTELSRSNSSAPSSSGFTRSTAHVNFSNVEFSPWDVAHASQNIPERAIKPYTIMIYMNGSDLESEHGAATDDLIEMLDSGLHSEHANIIIFTGGTKAWQNDLIPEYDCVIWEVSDGEILKLASVGLRNMGNAGTLSSFIDFGMLNFPAHKYGLVLWDHGGGSISGYGHDELFGDDNMTLLDFNFALKESVAADTKLEFIGFDTCLLGSVEMAVISADYATYLIASEDLIPGDGWDYHFLSVLNHDPHMSGAVLGKAITDYFMDFYGPNYFDELNMSVIDLNYAKHVMYAMGALMEKGSHSLADYTPEAFRNLARRRSLTKTFGIGSPRDNESDMVDIGHMAYMLFDLYPLEVDALREALIKAVIYNRNNSDIELSGISTFYLYGGKRIAKDSLSTYSSLNMDYEYTRFLYEFSSTLLKRGRPRRSSSHEDIIEENLTIWQQVSQDSDTFIMIGINEEVNENYGSFLWPLIEGFHVCMYKISSSTRGNFYAIPSIVNGVDCDLIVLINEERPEGIVLGTRNENGIISQKGYIDIKIGDEISFYYQLWGKDEWYKSDVFVVEDEPELRWVKLTNEELYKSVRSTCLWNDHHFGELERV